MYGQWCKIDGNILLAEKSPSFSRLFHWFLQSYSWDKEVLQKPTSLRSFGLRVTAHQKVIKIPPSINSVPFFFQNAIPPGRRRGIFHLPKMEKRFYKTLRNVNWMWFPHAAPEFFIVPTILRPIKFKDGEELFKELQYRRRTMWRWGSRIPRLGLRDSFFPFQSIVFL